MEQPLDIDNLRKDTTGLNPAEWLQSDSVQITGGHFNNAGAGLPPVSVKVAMEKAINLECTIGGYEASERLSKENQEELYSEIAKLIGATGGSVEKGDNLTGAQCIAIVDSSTSAWANAFYSIPFQKGDIVITSQVEYGANYVAFLQLAKSKGIQIEVAPSTSSGIVDVAKLAARLAADSSMPGAKGNLVRCVAITHIPTNGGVVNPCEAIGDVVYKHNQVLGSSTPAGGAGTGGGKDHVLYLVDACQTFGQKPIDVTVLKCHFLSAAARKYLRGPRGIGFLYVSPAVLLHHRDVEPVTLDHFSAPWDTKTSYQLRVDARRYERFEFSLILRMGFLAAAKYANNVVGVHRSWPRIRMLAAKLRIELAGIGSDLVQVRDLGTPEEQCGICTFTVTGKMATDVVALLRRDHGFNLSVTKTMSTRLDMEERQLVEMARASVHYYNTEGEVEALVQAVKTVATKQS